MQKNSLKVMADLILETKQEARIEKLITILRNYGLPVIGLVLIATIVYSIWGNHNADISAKVGDKMYEAISSDLSVEEQKKTLKEIMEYDHSYRYIAQLKLADLLTQENNLEGASKIYDELANDKKAVEYISDLAYQRLMIMGSKDIGNQNIYYFSSMLIKTITLLEKENNKEASNLLKDLKDNFETPLPIKELTEEILTTLSHNN